MTYKFGTESVEEKDIVYQPLKKEINFFLIWWLQMAFIAIWYMLSNLFAIQHIADRPG